MRVGVSYRVPPSRVQGLTGCSRVGRLSMVALLGGTILKRNYRDMHEGGPGYFLYTAKFYCSCVYPVSRTEVLYSLSDQSCVFSERLSPSCPCNRT